MTSFELEILMHHYVCPGPFRDPELRLYKEIVLMWQKEGFICVNPHVESMIGVTNEGKEFIERLLSTEKHPPRMWGARE